MVDENETRPIKTERPTATYETLENQETDAAPAESLENNAEKSSVFGAIMNTTNSIVGAGIIAIPYALKECGFVLGILSLFIIGILSGYTLILLYKAAEWTKKKTYHEVVESTFGQPYVAILGVMQFAFPFLAMVSYQVIISDNMSSIVKAVSLDSPVADRRLLLLIMTLCVALPLSYFKLIQSLAKVSLLSVISVLLLVLTVIYKASTQTHQKAESSFGIGEYVIQSWGIILFAYVCHHNSFLIMNSLKERTESNYHIVVWSSIGVSAIAMSIMGICGYIIFSDNVVGNLLQNFCPCDTLVNLARVAFIVGVVTTFPLECFVCRDIIQTSFFKNWEESELRHAVITVGLVVTVTGISLCTDRLGLILEASGILTAIPYAFIYPPALYLKLDPNGSTVHTGKVAAILQLTFGCLFFILGLTGVVLKILRNVSETPDLSYCETYCNKTLSELLNNS